MGDVANLNKPETFVIKKNTCKLIRSKMQDNEIELDSLSLKIVMIFFKYLRNENAAEV